MHKPGNPLMASIRDAAAFYVPHSQQGVVLAVSLVFLLMLTLLAVVSMNTGTLQQKMAGNTRDMDISFQAAESALRFGERTLSSTVSAAGGKIPQCMAGSNIWCFRTVLWTNTSWWNANSIPYMGDAAKQILEASDDPRVMIEYIGPDDMSGGERYALNVNNPAGPPKASKFFRITARGVGVTGVSETVAESTYVFIDKDY